MSPYLHYEATEFLDQAKLHNYAFRSGTYFSYKSYYKNYNNLGGNAAGYYVITKNSRVPTSLQPLPWVLSCKSLHFPESVDVFLVLFRKEDLPFVNPHAPHSQPSNRDAVPTTLLYTTPDTAWAIPIPINKNPNLIITGFYKKLGIPRKVQQ